MSKNRNLVPTPGKQGTQKAQKLFQFLIISREWSKTNKSVIPNQNFSRYEYEKCNSTPVRPSVESGFTLFTRISFDYPQSSCIRRLIVFTFHRRRMRKRYVTLRRLSCNFFFFFRGKNRRYSRSCRMAKSVYFPTTYVHDWPILSSAFNLKM